MTASRLKKLLMTVLSSLSVCLLLAGGVYGQDPRGSIIGRVTDSSNAVIPSVEVRAVNNATQVAASATTNAAGNFSMPFLAPGTYTVTAEATGFKKFARSGIQLHISEVAEINIAMELGQLTESIEVTSEAPLLDTAAASLGQVVDEKRLSELPLYAGNPLELMYITTGIVNPSSSMPRLHSPWNNLSVESNGNGGRSNDFSIDGVPNTYPNGSSRGARPAYNPPTTAVSEFKIQTTSYDASVGHTIGASVNVGTKSGTNKFHGGVHWIFKNSALDAPSFFDNRSGEKPPVYQNNRYGVDIGGPVRLPHYNGKNRTFFFYAFEGNKWTIPEPYTDTVPTAAQRLGDFSNLLALGSQYQIYDPETATVAPNGRLSRLPFSENTIPADRQDPAGRNLAAMYPLPNQPGTKDGMSNFYAPAVSREDYFTHLVRVDHSLDDNQRLFVRLHYDEWDEDQLRRLGPNNPASGVNTASRDKGVALDYVNVLSPTLVMNFRYGITYQLRSDYRVSKGIDLAGLGFSPSLVGLIDPEFATIPYSRPGQYARISRFWDGDGANTGLIHNFNANFTKLHTQHNLKFGASFRAYRSFGNRFPYATSPYLRYGATYTRGPLDNSPAAPIGQGLAAMLLGLPDDGYMELTPSFALNGPSLGLYIQDDYKLSRKLTVNLGLRWEYDLPVTERYDRLVTGFAANTSNPIEAAAKANYAANPISELPVNDFHVLGGLTWVGQGGAGRSPFTTGKTNFMPRIGLAYQITPETVLRAGYGIFYDTVGVNQTVPIQIGYSQTTPVQVSLDGGLTFVASTSNPLPGGLLQPLGPKGGLTTNLGQSLNFYRQTRKNPYAQRWSFGFQQLLPQKFLLEASYIGNRGTRLEIPREINATPGQYLSTSFFRDQETIDYMSERLSSPFKGVDPIFGSTITRTAMLKPYPHFGSITFDDNVGYSWYHALQLRTEKRFSQGYTFQLAYTYSKLMQATEFLNAFDPLPYESIGYSDRPHQLSATGIWELPFGRGRRFGAQMPGVLDALAGGWQLGGIFRFQSGAPLEFGDAIFIGDIKDIALDGGQRTVDRWFNTEAGFNRSSSQQRAYNVRSFPLRFGGIRGAPQNRWDLSIKKNFNFTEAVKMEFRAEAINAFNHAVFTPPNTTPTSSSFGRVTGVAWPGRNWQFGLNLKF
jgi:outer membrane receptor protein involved in Fe transport